MRQRRKKFNQEDTEKLYWRYKKTTPPTDEFAAQNGPVRVIKSATRGKKVL